MKKLLTLAVILCICLLPLTAQVKLYKENSTRPYKMQNTAESRIITWLEDAEIEVIPAGQFARGSLAHRTLSGAPPDSPVPQTETASWLYTAKSSLLFFFLFLTLRQIY